MKRLLALRPLLRHNYRARLTEAYLGLFHPQPVAGQWWKRSAAFDSLAVTVQVFCLLLLLLLLSVSLCLCVLSVSVCLSLSLSVSVCISLSLSGFTVYGCLNFLIFFNCCSFSLFSPMRSSFCTRTASRDIMVVSLTLVEQNAAVWLTSQP